MFPGGPEGDQACRAGIEDFVRHLFERIGREVSLISERRNQRDVEAAQRKFHRSSLPSPVVQIQLTFLH